MQRQAQELKKTKIYQFDRRVFDCFCKEAMRLKDYFS